MLIAIPDIFETSENIQIFYCKGNLKHSKRFKKKKTRLQFISVF